MCAGFIAAKEAVNLQNLAFIHMKRNLQANTHLIETARKQLQIGFQTIENSFAFVGCFARIMSAELRKIFRIAILFAP